MKPRKILIITSSGGGGLLQAAVAKEQAAREQDPKIQIVKRDVLKDWMWDFLGRFSIAYWNGAQRRGHVKAQEFVMRTQWIFDLFAWPNVFYHTLRTLLREDVDRVIDTQAIGTSAILKAIRAFNRFRQKNLILEKIVVDLPTPAATHYFRSIKPLSQKDKKVLHLSTIAPLLEEGESAEQFWQKHCGISNADVHYEGLNVRQSFKKIQGKARGQEATFLAIRFQNSEELRLICKCCDRGLIQYRVQKHKIQCIVEPQDRVATVLLGSQPAAEATLNYVKQFLSVAQNNEASKIPLHLFVFCAEHEPDENSLFRKVVDVVTRAKPYPKRFSVIPFSFQSDEEIAPLFHRSDLTCTRSGGQTAMELMAVSSGQMWIHSEAKKGKKPLTLDELIQGIPGWEGANALYLHKLCGAQIVTPEICAPILLRSFGSVVGRASPIAAPESTA